jgi:hypothetical protein
MHTNKQCSKITNPIWIVEIQNHVAMNVNSMRPLYKHISGKSQIKNTYMSTWQSTLKAYTSTIKRGTPHTGR